MHTDPESSHEIERAAQHLIAGGLVAFPTETVYGLGADAENAQAIAKIYKAKNRPANHPLIVHLAPGADLAYWTDSSSPYVQPLIDAFWPGPLTLIVPRAANIPAVVSGGQPTIGLRCPSHPVAQALISHFAKLKPSGQGGVAAPSANKFGHISPTRAEHVRSEFPELSCAELQILEGEPARVGIESTIVDISHSRDDARPVILRPGQVSAEQIGQVLGVLPADPHSASPQVSGTLKAHYAPITPLRLVRPQELLRVIQELSGTSQSRVAALVFQVPKEAYRLYPNVDFYRCQHTSHDYARELYGVLRRLDGKSYAALLIEHPPKTPEWVAVNDRLGRAAAAFS